MTSILALVIPLIAQDRQTVERKIQAITIDVNWTDRPLSEVVDFIRDLANINILIDAEAKAKDVKVTLQLKGVRLKTALNFICQAHDLGTRFEGDVLILTTKEKAAGDVVLEIFDVQDMVMPIKHFPGGEIQFGDEAGTMNIPPPPEDPSPDMSEFLIELVKTYTGAKVWDDNPKAGIVYQNGTLVVRQTREVQRKIQRILLQYRSLQ
jgi:type II secretory pathway component GspD/PulD (secretin)